MGKRTGVIFVKKKFLLTTNYYFYSHLQRQNDEKNKRHDLKDMTRLNDISRNGLPFMYSDLLKKWKLRIFHQYFSITFSHNCRPTHNINIGQSITLMDDTVSLLLWLIALHWNTVLILVLAHESLSRKRVNRGWFGTNNNVPYGMVIGGVGFNKN